MRALMILLAAAAMTQAQTTQPLRLEKTIEMPDVQGRIIFATTLVASEFMLDTEVAR